MNSDINNYIKSDINTLINKIMNTQSMITFLGFFLVFIGIFFSSTLLILLLPALLILIGILKLYEWYDK